MNILSAARDKEFQVQKAGVWEYIIYVSLSIGLIVVVSKFVFNLVPKRSELVRTEKVAIKTYRQYSQRLDAISIKYAKELEAAQEIK